MSTSHPGRFTPGKELPHPLNKKLGGLKGRSRPFLRGNKSLAPAGIWTPDSWAHSVVTTPRTKKKPPPPPKILDTAYTSPQAVHKTKILSTDNTKTTELFYIRIHYNLILYILLEQKCNGIQYSYLVCKWAYQHDVRRRRLGEKADLCHIYMSLKNDGGCRCPSSNVFRRPWLLNRTSLLQPLLPIQRERLQCWELLVWFALRHCRYSVVDYSWLKNWSGSGTNWQWPNRGTKPP